MSTDRIPEWMRGEGDEKHWRFVCLLVDSHDDNIPAYPFEDHDPGECTCCDAARLRNHEQDDPKQ